MKKEIINYTYIVLGSLLLAVGVVGFLDPNKIVTGGTAGLAIAIHHLINLPIGVILVLINVPLLIVSTHYLGKYFAIKTIITIGIIALFIDFLAEGIHFPMLSNNILLATLYGGVVIGVGLGFIFKGGASAGGGTILAKIIVSKFNVKTGSVILALDVIVVVLAGYVFESLELAFWGIISIFTASKMIDMVLTGRSNEKIVHISSGKNLKDLSTIIGNSLGISGTIIQGDDLQHHENKDIIFIVVENNKLNLLKQLVLSYDHQARMIVMEATELLGGVK